MDYKDIRSDEAINRDLEDDQRNKDFVCDGDCRSCDKADACEFYNGDDDDREELKKLDKPSV